MAASMSRPQTALDAILGSKQPEILIGLFFFKFEKTMNLSTPTSEMDKTTF